MFAYTVYEISTLISKTKMLLYSTAISNKYHAALLLKMLHRQNSVTVDGLGQKCAIMWMAVDCCNTNPNPLLTVYSESFHS